MKIAGILTSLILSLPFAAFAQNNVPFTYQIGGSVPLLRFGLLLYSFGSQVLLLTNCGRS